MCYMTYYAITTPTHTPHKMKYLLLALPLLWLGCSESTTFDQVAQNQTDRQKILKYLSDNGLTATEDASGLFYYIDRFGDANGLVPDTTAALGRDSIAVQYTGRLLNGNIFDNSYASRSISSPVRFLLKGLVSGWHKGIPKIRKNGAVRMYIPSNLGYGNSANGSIPANSILIFDVELIDVY